MKRDLGSIKRPIIFIGTGRSGTTIISEVIMRHQDLAFPSRYQDLFPKSARVNMIRHLFENKFWKLYGQKKQLNNVSFFHKMRFKPSEAYKMWDSLTSEEDPFSRSFLYNREASSSTVQIVNDFFKRVLYFQGRERLVFKITGPSRIGYLKSIFPEAQFIWLHRKIVPTVHSFLKVGFWEERGAHQLWWKGVYSEEEKKWAQENSNNSLALTAFQLGRINHIAELEVRDKNPSLLKVSYEKFVSEPEKTLSEINDFLGLRDSSEGIKYLNSIRIFNQNKRAEEYFSSEELKLIKKLSSIEKLPSW